MFAWYPGSRPVVFGCPGAHWSGPCEHCQFERQWTTLDVKSLGCNVISVSKHYKYKKIHDQLLHQNDLKNQQNDDKTQQTDTNSKK